MTPEQKLTLCMLYKEAIDGRNVEFERMRECANSGNKRGAEYHQQNVMHMEGMAHGIKKAARAFQMGFHWNEKKGIFELREFDEHL